MGWLQSILVILHVFNSYGNYINVTKTVFHKSSFKMYDLTARFSAIFQRETTFVCRIHRFYIYLGPVG